MHGETRSQRKLLMSRLRTCVVLGVLLSLLVPGLGARGQTAVAIYFYEVGCLHCARIGDILSDLQAIHPGLTVVRHDIHTLTGRHLLSRLLAAYNAQVGPVPMVFVGDVAMVGGTFYGLSDQAVDLTGLAEEWTLQGAVESALAEDAPSPLARLPQTATELVLFVRENDPESEALESWTMQVLERKPHLALRRLSLEKPENAKLLAGLMRLYNVRGDPPAFFVGDLAMVGGLLSARREAARPFDGSPESEAYVDATINQAVASEAASPVDRYRLREQVTLWAVIGAAALDSVNPCDFAVLVLLLGTLLVIGKRGKVIGAGLAFTAGIFISYYLLGFVVYTVLGVTVGTRGFREPFIYAVSALAILIGLWEMKDLLWYGKWFSIEVPERWKPRLKAATASVITIPGAFLVGVLDSLFLAPCTSGPYLAILSLLSQTTERLYGAMLLLVYNLIFVLPMIAITLMVHFGVTTTARAERWRQAKLTKLHFVTGLVMVALGAGMIVGVQLGLL
jgi:cytochrome c biogenesis protein CcdA